MENNEEEIRKDEEVIIEEDSKTKELSKLEKFFQFNNENLSEEEKNKYSTISLISSIIWIIATFFGLVLGPIWFILASILLFKMVSIGIKSNKKGLTVVSIVLYAFNVVVYIISLIFTFQELIVS